jgi:O-antigen/teichoic acid export membrane protein
MGQQTMNETTYANVYGTIFTVILTFISHFTLSDGAALAAIFAGVTTGGYNIYKFIKDRNNGNPKP